MVSTPEWHTELFQWISYTILKAIGELPSMIGTQNDELDRSNMAVVNRPTIVVFVSARIRPLYVSIPSLSVEIGLYFRGLVN